MKFANLTATEIAQKIRAKEFTAQAITTAYLDRIRQLDPQIHAFNEVFAEHALLQARDVDVRLAKGESLGPLAGVPIAIKDNLLIRGEHCTCSSKILKNFVGTYDATVIEKLRRAGAVFLGPASSEPVGDYFAGTNHILPTNGAARFASSLSVDDFLKTISIVAYTERRLAKTADKIVKLAEGEGLEAHAAAIRVRLRE